MYPNTGTHIYAIVWIANGGDFGYTRKETKGMDVQSYIHGDTIFFTTSLKMDLPLNQCMLDVLRDEFSELHLASNSLISG
eukprot:c23215_g1_i3 orf=193-432(+)